MKSEVIWKNIENLTKWHFTMVLSLKIKFRMSKSNDFWKLTKFLWKNNILLLTNQLFVRIYAYFLPWLGKTSSFHKLIYFDLEIAKRCTKKFFSTPHDEFCVSWRGIWNKETCDRYLQTLKIYLIISHICGQHDCVGQSCPERKNWCFQAILTSKIT